VRDDLLALDARARPSTNSITYGDADCEEYDLAIGRERGRGEEGDHDYLAAQEKGSESSAAPSP
jgi:hypothetical protein